MSKQWAKEEANTNEIATVLERGAVWVKFHPQQSIWGGIGLAASIFIVAAFFIRSRQAREESWAQLSAATMYAQSGQAEASLNQVKALTEAHPGSAASGYARLLAGDVLFQQAKYKEAAQAYQGATEQPGVPATIPMALSGLALSQEGAGDCPAATAAAQRFLDTHQDHFLAPITHASLARCLAAQGKPEAKETFQRIEILYPGTYWEAWAKARKG